MDNIVLSRKVRQALSQNKPVLALESSILSQGMPYPDNYTFAKKAENLCLGAKVTPATIAILDGVVFVGLSEKQLKFVCEEKNNLYRFFFIITFKSFYILIIRSFPILPHVLGSYIIASSKIKKKAILINTFLGSFFYYVFLYLIIGNV